MKTRTATAMVGTLLALLWSAPVLAQGGYIGARLGWTRTFTSLEVNGVKPENLDYQNNVLGGILGGYGFTPTVAFQAEVLWTPPPSTRSQPATRGADGRYPLRAAPPTLRRGPTR